CITDSESTLDNIEFQRRLAICARRCQSNDTDLSKFRDSGAKLSTIDLIRMASLANGAGTALTPRPTMMMAELSISASQDMLINYGIWWVSTLSVHMVSQDAPSGYIAARPMRITVAETVAMDLHGIFCEHGSPRVVMSDRALASILTKVVRSIMDKHGTRQYSLPGYSQHLLFWEKSHRDLHRDLTLTSKAIMDYTLSYLLAIRCYNSTPRHWSTISPSALHYAYRQWLPTDPPTDFPSVDWGKLEIEYLNVDYLTPTSGRFYLLCQICRRRLRLPF
ncbi:hypothetical protein FOZ62_011862, partial [Perkinsus olseni]